MARSYKKNPFHGNAKCRSEKQDKRKANRAYRRAVRLVIVGQKFELMPILREISDTWSFGKDGKRYNPEWIEGRRK